MKTYKIHILILFYLILSFCLFAKQNNPPQLILAQDSQEDPWYPYIKRSLLPIDLISKDIKSRTIQKITHLPWTLLPPENKDSEIFKLKDVVVDRIRDPETGQKYIKLYHGTTSDLLDIFKKGADEIKFNLADRTALGMGFYLTANPNEAKNYACARLRLRKDEKDLRALLLVVGVKDLNKIQGKLVEPKTNTAYAYSDDDGNPINKNIYFIRNNKRYNQFVFFSNIAPYLRIFKIIIIPNNFGKSKNFQDYDGLDPASKEPEFDKALKCTL